MIVEPINKWIFKQMPTDYWMWTAVVFHNYLIGERWASSDKKKIVKPKIINIQYHIYKK